MQRQERLGAASVALLVLLCTLWGVQQTAVKVAVVQGLPPILMAALRSLGAALLVFLWIGLRQGAPGLRGVFARPTLLPGIIAGLAFGVEFAVLFPGLALTTASRGVLFLYTAPFFTALGAHLFLPSERLRPRQIAGLVTAFAGVALAFSDGLRSGAGSVLGDLLCALGGLIWGFTTVFIKANPALRTAPAAYILLFQLLWSAPGLLLAAALLGNMNAFPDASALAWWSLGYQTVIVTFASYLAWFWLVMRTPAAVVSGFTFLTPVMGIAAGWLLLGEQASFGLLGGLVAVAIGMRLIR